MSGYLVSLVPSFIIFMSKLTIAGIIAVILGFVSGYIQNTYYGYVDEQGILHDSIFLPLSFLLITLGVVLLALALFSVLRK